MLTGKWWLVIEGEPVTVNPGDMIAPVGEIVTAGSRPIVDEATAVATWPVARVTAWGDAAAGTITDQRAFARHGLTLGEVLAHTHRFAPMAHRSAAPLEYRISETCGDATVNSHTATFLSRAARCRPAGLDSNMASEVRGVFADRRVMPLAVDRLDHQLFIVATVGQMCGATHVGPLGNHEHRNTATDPAVARTKVNTTILADRNFVAAVDRALATGSVRCTAPDDRRSVIEMVQAEVPQAAIGQIQGPAPSDPHGVRTAVQGVRNAVPAIEVAAVVVPISNAGRPARTRHPARIVMTVHRVREAGQVSVSVQTRIAAVAADRHPSVVLVVDHLRSADAADRTGRAMETGRQVAGNVRTTMMTRTMIATRPPP